MSAQDGVDVSFRAKANRDDATNFRSGAVWGRSLSAFVLTGLTDTSHPDLETSAK